MVGRGRLLTTLFKFFYKGWQSERISSRGISNKFAPCLHLCLKWVLPVILCGTQFYWRRPPLGGQKVLSNMNHVVSNIRPPPKSPEVSNFNKAALLKYSEIMDWLYGTKARWPRGEVLRHFTQACRTSETIRAWWVEWLYCWQGTWIIVC